MVYTNWHIHTTLLVKFHDERFRDGNVSIKRLLRVIGKDLFGKLLTIARCDIYAQSSYKRDDKLKLIDDVEDKFQIIISENHCYSLAQLDVDGYDIISMGYEGEDIGLVLNLLLEAVIENKIDNSKKSLLSWPLYLAFPTADCGSHCALHHRCTGD